MKPLQLKDQSKLKPLVENHIRVSELNFTNLFAWRDKYKFHVAEVEDIPVVINIKGDKQYYSMPLITPDNLMDFFVSMKSTFETDVLHFKKSDENFVQKVQELDLATEIIEIRDDFDYLYDFEALKHLSGNKYHKKRNHVNHFIKAYEYHFQMIDKTNMKDVLSVCDVWFEGADENLLMEKKAIDEVLEHYEALGVIGGILYVYSKPVGFVIGEITHGDTLLVHFEKADTQYHSVYTMLENQFLNHIEPVKYVNREQDLGIPGLRKSKLSYHPITFIKKYEIKIKF